LRQRTEEEHRSHVDTGARGSGDLLPSLDDSTSDSEDELCGHADHVSESDVGSFLARREELGFQTPHDAHGPFSGTLFRELDLDRLARGGDFVAYDIEHLEAYLAGETDTSSDSSGTVAFEGSVAKCHKDLGANLMDGDVLVFEVADDGSLQKATVVRERGNLSRDDLKTYGKEVGVSRFKELKGLVDLGCFARMPRKMSKNRLDTRWVETWKQVEGQWIIKSRLTMRGFKDREQSLETFAGTASRAGQRIVNSEAAQHRDMVLFSFDVSQAFAKRADIRGDCTVVGNTAARG